LIAFHLIKGVNEMSEVYRILAYADNQISVKYDSAESPYFETIVSESLSRIVSRPVGKLLLYEIGECWPVVMFEWPDSLGENVKILPTYEKANYKVRGIQGRDEWETNILDLPFQKREAARKKLIESPNSNIDLLKGLMPSGVRGHDFLLTGAENAKASKDVIAAEDGRGSVATINFSNAKRTLSSGLASPPFIALAHELIHALHGLKGEKKGTTKEEEERTVGIGDFGDEPISENKIRSEHGVVIRKVY
jgi:hypothetical protein